MAVRVCRCWTARSNASKTSSRRTLAAPAAGGMCMNQVAGKDASRTNIREQWCLGLRTITHSSREGILLHFADREST
jgi:hypothetical protein